MNKREKTHLTKHASIDQIDIKRLYKTILGKWCYCTQFDNLDKNSIDSCTDKIQTTKAYLRSNR